MHSLAAINGEHKTEKVVKILNINTLFRKNYYGQSSTDFIIDLPETLKNVTSLTLMNSEIPNTIYTFSSKLGTNEFTIETYQKEEAASPSWKILKKKKHLIRIRDGNYTALELCNYLNKYVFSPDAIAELKRVCCHYDKNSKKIIFLRAKLEFYLKQFDFKVDSFCRFDTIEVYSSDAKEIHKLAASRGYNFRILPFGSSVTIFS